MPKQRIYRRLGYAKGKTRVDNKQKLIVDKTIEQSVAFIELKGACVRVPVRKADDFKITLDQDVSFESKSLAKFLQGCGEVFLMGATAGSKIIQAINEYSDNNDVKTAVIFDAAASEMVDRSLDWIMKFSSQELLRENKCLTKQRFSAGYGDFSIENQRIVYSLLNMERLGVRLTESYMLVPEKSVTAVAGIQAVR